jgi:hypothetical protein
MNIIFVGSLDAQTHDLKTISDNLKSLVKIMARNGDGFVIRGPKLENQNRIPIDFLVYEALEEYCSDNGILKESTLTLFKEPGVSSSLNVDLPHISHSATTAYRIEFYKELLDLVDIVVGIGGEFGLLRLSMLCEWLGKPIFLLPGAGGTTDFLWQEFFKKSYQTIFLSDKEIKRLKQTPFIDETNPKYSETIYDLIRLVNVSVEKGFSKNSEFVTPDNITIGLIISSIKKFSVGLWFIIITTISILCSISYYLGKKGFF